MLQRRTAYAHNRFMELKPAGGKTRNPARMINPSRNICRSMESCVRSIEGIDAYSIPASVHSSSSVELPRPPVVQLVMDTAEMIAELGDALIAEAPLKTPAPAGRREIAPTMGNVDKMNYSHADMIDFIIANPGCTQNQLAARYGYSPGWVSNVMASDAWQTMMAARRTELVDPVLAATVEERFRGLTMKSMQKLDALLDLPACPPQVVLKAVELGAKAMGYGGNMTNPPPPPATDHLAQLANRLIDLQANVRKGVTYEDAEIVRTEAA